MGSTPDHPNAGTPPSLIHKGLRGVPRKLLPVWAKTIGNERNQLDLLLLPEHCEEGVLTPTADGYTYKTEKRFECADIYCQRYMDALHARNLTGHEQAEVTSPLPTENEMSDQDAYMWDSGEQPHHNDNSMQLGEPNQMQLNQLNQMQPSEAVHYTLINPIPPQPSWFYDPTGEASEHVTSEGHSTSPFTATPGDMDTASDSTDGLGFPTPNPLWNWELYNQLYQYGHSGGNYPLPPPPSG